MGRPEGQAEGYAEAILLAFESHNITLDAENRQAILDWQDTALLRTAIACRAPSTASGADCSNSLLAEASTLPRLFIVAGR